MAYIKFSTGLKIDFPREALTGGSPSVDARNYLKEKHPDLVGQFDKDMEAKIKVYDALFDRISEHTGVKRLEQ